MIRLQDSSAQTDFLLGNGAQKVARRCAFAGTHSPVSIDSSVVSVGQEPKFKSCKSFKLIQNFRSFL